MRQIQTGSASLLPTHQAFFRSVNSISFQSSPTHRPAVLVQLPLSFPPPPPPPALSTLIFASATAIRLLVRASTPHTVCVCVCVFISNGCFFSAPSFRQIGHDGLHQTLRFSCLFSPPPYFISLSVSFLKHTHTHRLHGGCSVVCYAFRLD